MAALTLNLLAEEQLAQQERARDPVKVVIAVGIGLVAIATASGALLGGFVATRKSEANQLRSKWDALQAAEFSAEQGGFQSMQTLADDLVAINRSRVLYAPQLALIKDLIPPSVQLVQLSLVMAPGAKKSEAEPAPPQTGAAPPVGKVRRPATPAAGDRLLLRLDGTAFSRRPEIEVDKFLQLLRDDVAFSEQVDQIQLRSIASGSAGTEAGKVTVPTATFVIECTYKERLDPQGQKEPNGAKQQKGSKGAAQHQEHP